MGYIYLQCLNNKEHYMVGINGRSDGCKCPSCKGILIPKREATREEYIKYKELSSNNKTKGITIEISGNADKFNAVLDEVQAKAEKLERTLKNVVNLISSLNSTTIDK